MTTRWSGALALVIALAACKKERGQEPPTPTPQPEPPVSPSVVLFEPVQKHIGPGYGLDSYQRALIPLVCWNAAAKAFGVGMACIDVVPRPAEVAQRGNVEEHVAIGGRVPAFYYRGIEGRAVMGIGNIYTR